MMERVIGVGAVLACSCGSSSVPPSHSAPPVATSSSAEARGTTFRDDLAFLRQHVEVIVLADTTGDAQVAIVPEYQGRVMTSTATGMDGTSLGFIHRPVIAARARQPHMTVVGGEDRFWLGPEGGQYSLYFSADEPFDLEHWEVPEPLDWGPWELVRGAQVAEASEAQQRAKAEFRKRMYLVNYVGTAFDIEVERTIRLLNRAEVIARLGAAASSSAVQAVGFASVNTLSNRGSHPWRKETGLVSMWILGMFPPSPHAVVVIPFIAGPDAQRGPVVNDRYFGAVPADRLVVDASEGVLFFSADGQRRSKIGIPRARAKPVLGSWDPVRGVLTIVRYTLPDDATDYVSSMWEMQREPFRGDVVNGYNDGPPEPGKPPLGPFYELETSSPAAALAPGESITHSHETMHFSGPRAALDRIARAQLGVGLDRIESAL